MNRAAIIEAATALVGIHAAILAGQGAIPRPRILVVYRSGVEAFAEVLEAIRTGLPPDVLGVIDLNDPNSRSQLGRGLGQSPAILIAVGGEASRTLASHNLTAPVISTMIMEADREKKPHGAVCLDVPLAKVLRETARLFPGRKRLGIIRNPLRERPAAGQLKEQAALEGFASVVVDCPGPEGLLSSFNSLAGKVDFVLALPDSSLYNGATVRPLILASLDRRLPIIGFSSSFVRAGAALGVYPDFRGVGEQTAEMAARCLASQQCSGQEQARDLVVAVNQKVTRLIGLDFQASRFPQVVVVR
ncbi:MAG: hypothetical protein IT158_31255 [Bryobacterales bacterium]|nr:hypothetical protein [Bryobacterales bacterium]